MLDLPNAESFAVTQQNCAAGLAALDMAGLIIRADNPWEQALVITGEKAFSRLNQDYLSLGSVMGEAASATLVSRGGPGDTIRSYAARTRGEFAAGILMSPDDKEAHGSAGEEELVEVIRKAVDRAALTLDDIDLVIPHNPDMTPVADRLGMGRDRFFTENLARHSHCYASDVFVNYATLRGSGRLLPGAHYLLVAAGLGATYSAMVITHEGNS
jgi:3-oxoacyl-[acyl-carrier-protein] synthase-3